MKKKKLSRRAASAGDRDNPAWTSRDFAKAKRFDQLPETLREGLRVAAKRGRPRKLAPKKQLSLRLDAGLVDYLRRSGGYNTRIESMLLKAWDERRL